jgi:hypothetical protein
MQTETRPVAAECFVVMPFGRKPLPDGRTYDFDKVYRVIITRAVQEAGMKPLRADETVGSRLIHSDMFKDLRDRAVVLADLSLENPNVFYELGIRHVMSPTGTVLMCREGTDLPFDVRLSRVIFYKFNGEALDWEEVEETIKKLKLALQDARQEQPDSPVHVLLDPVLRNDSRPSMWLATTKSAGPEMLEKYERRLAELWREQGHKVEELLPDHCDTVFGLRALGYFCMLGDRPADGSALVAENLSTAEQYALASEIYARLKDAGRLTTDDLMKYAGSYSEAHPDLPGAQVAIGYAREALADTLARIASSPGENYDEIATLGHAHRRLAGLLQWKWLLTGDDADCVASIDEFARALVQMMKARPHGKFPHPGLIAQTRLKLMLLLRSSDLARHDVEGHRDAILKIATMPGDQPVGISYLHWFQAVTLGDLGADDQANRKALDQLATDSKLLARPDCLDIGRRQYVLLRRFIEQFAGQFKNPQILGRISRHLYMGLQKTH